jgi:hypothetical protein
LHHGGSYKTLHTYIWVDQIATYNVESRALVEGLRRKGLDGDICVLVVLLTETNCEELNSAKAVELDTSIYRRRGLPLQHIVRYLCTDSIIIGFMSIRNTLAIIITKILNTQTDSKCRLCQQFDETIDHVISACLILAKKRYIKRHDRVSAQLHFAI